MLNSVEADKPFCCVELMYTAAEDAVTYVLQSSVLLAAYTGSNRAQARQPSLTGPGQGSRGRAIEGHAGPAGKQELA